MPLFLSSSISCSRVYPMLLNCAISCLAYAIIAGLISVPPLTFSRSPITRLLIPVPSSFFSSDKSYALSSRYTMLYRILCILHLIYHYPKYLSRSPLNALPCLASSRAISWTVSWIASRFRALALLARSVLPAVAPFSASTRS